MVEPSNIQESGAYAFWQNATIQSTGNSGILILGDTGVAFQSLLSSMQKCFPSVKIVLSSQIPDDDKANFEPRLILIDAFAFRSITTLMGECRESYPDAHVALMVEGGWNDDPALRAIVAERAIQGLVPFNLPINVWLATIWLLLNGGEYFPHVVSPRSAARGFLSRRGPSNSSDPHAEAAGVLSSREAEVLELMSDGLQNKIIASKMALSEHTVKVHVHNIIRKLKVHNRTQAAAVFRSLDRRPLYDTPSVRASAQG